MRYGVCRQADSVIPSYYSGMTERFRKLSISVPEDVAERLERESNTSAFLVNTVRARMRLENLTTMHEEFGITVTPEGVARARARRAAVEAEWTPERRAAVREHARQGARDKGITSARPSAA
ncbi:hypothetical protein GCM10011608_26220 [Micromonospora sonchi]|uniref:Uncharacterized protein n=2 Tax=Micromonospora sonchi TaxID=1763543 RepID=A0A917WY52_9ACTN|nr:hypothetical protein GCM10011608_26220 [Micromonospora sonchi]